MQILLEEYFQRLSVVKILVNIVSILTEIICAMIIIYNFKLVRMKGGRGMPGLRKGMNAANKNKNKEKPKEKEN